MDSISRSDQNDDHNAGRRAREVYRYFRPEESSSIEDDILLTSTEVLSPEQLQHCNASTSPHISPSISSRCLSASPTLKEPVWPPVKHMPESLVLGNSNATLTSFAQLAALRLGMNRVFISVSDRDSQFIIAQAAQTVEETKEYDLLGGGVYTGCSTLDVTSWKMCRDTVAMSTSNRETGEYQFLVSTDLTQDERYQDLPLVREKPHFRFYAGTPLTTESKINLGCLFALDTKPHTEFTHEQRETMAHMGMLIMDFLKVSREATEGRRAARLSLGLSHFVEGRSSVQEASDDQSAAGSSQAGTMSPSTRSRTDHLGVELHHVRSSPRAHSRNTSTCSWSSKSEGKSESSLSSSLDAPFLDRPSNDSQRHGDMHKGIPWTFRRAANLIRESLELHGDSGVVFVEANNDNMLDSETNSDFSSSLEAGKPATISAISTESSPFGPDFISPITYPVLDLDEEFLHRVLRRYQKGKIWSFHRDGALSSSDDEAPRRKSRARTRISSGRPIGSKRRRTNENAILNKYFPGATQVMFIPLWNAANSQWFGGCFCWNAVESNVFIPSVELSSLLGFGSSIMAECNRVESIISDRQKADFLGSISHELRSPLHGILAAAELLQNTNLNGFQGSLMETINACGQTLLDTMNQVLDYSKIIALEREFRHLRKRSTSSLDLKDLHRSAAHLDTYMKTDLSVLAEEVAEGVCIGHYRDQNTRGSFARSMISAASEKSTDDPVDVIIDIAPHDWVYHIPPGALRRIIMNIFNNAIKYTEQGRVSLQLTVIETDDRVQRRSQGEDLVTITVSDTGKGISKEFLSRKLFVPFMQENSLVPGSGLGLPIVRSLVKSLGGNITIDSRLNHGTCVQVTLPLMRSSREDQDDLFGPSSMTDAEKDISDDITVFREINHGRTVAIWGVEPNDAFKMETWAALANYLTDWLGLSLVSPSLSDLVDVVLTDKFPSAVEINQCSLLMNSPVLIISGKNIGYNVMGARSSSFSKELSVINQPCGPHKLARAIQKCLSRALASESTAGSIVGLPEKQRNEKSKPPDKLGSMETESANQEASGLDQPLGFIPSLRSLSLSETSDSDTSSITQTPRILIVEDNKINLNLMLAFLKKREVSALDSAENGQLAVDAVKQIQKNYDIIFMDISMPVMNGFEATRAIRSLERNTDKGLQPSTIVALTGLSSARDESEALESGMDLFLTKPVTLKSITKILNKWAQKEPQDPSRS